MLITPGPPILCRGGGGGKMTAPIEDVYVATSVGTPNFSDILEFVKKLTPGIGDGIMR